VLDGLSLAGRQRAADSLTLLDSVHRRAEDLRAGLACATPEPAGTDALGPKLADCLRGSDNSSTPQHESGTGQKQGSKPTDATRKARPEQTVSPSPTVAAKKPAAAKVTPTKTAATPAQSDDPANLSDDSAGETGLDSLLNGIGAGSRHHRS
jgi:hypothetical protein